MILRRFMKHITDQNWFAVRLDVIVVIVGIVLGEPTAAQSMNEKIKDKFGWDTEVVQYMQVEKL